MPPDYGGYKRNKITGLAMSLKGYLFFVVSIAAVSESLGSKLSLGIRIAVCPSAAKRLLCMLSYYAAVKLFPLATWGQT